MASVNVSTPADKDDVETVQKMIKRNVTEPVEQQQQGGETLVGIQVEQTPKS
jgi:hypothetical protein